MIILHHVEDWNVEIIRRADKDAIREFVHKHADKLRGRVLDFGCGLSPYKSMVQPDATYVPWDLEQGDPAGPGVRPTGHWGDFPTTLPMSDAILCTQVMQYIPDPPRLLQFFQRAIMPGGHLVMTYPGAWREIEPTDYWRFTKCGMEQMLRALPLFQIVDHQPLAVLALPGFPMTLGYGLVAKAL